MKCSTKAHEVVSFVQEHNVEQHSASHHHSSTTAQSGVTTKTMQAMQAIHTFDGHAGRVFSLAVCSMSDGRRWAASASHDRTVRIWCLNTLQHMRTIEYTDFVWRVFIVKIPQPCVVAFISAESKIEVSDLQTGELLATHSGRLIFSGNVSIFPEPIIIAAEGEEDVSFMDVLSGRKLKTIKGGFDKMFRAVVTSGPNPMLVFTTWNPQTRRSTIQTYELCEDVVSEPPSPGRVLGQKQDQQPLQWWGSEGAGEGELGITNATLDALTLSAIDSNSKRSPTPTTNNSNLHSNMHNIKRNVSISALSEHSTVSSKDKMTLLFEGDSRDGVTSLVITLGSNKPMICSGHYDFNVRLWCAETKQLLRVLEGHMDYVGAVAAWKGDQSIVVSGSSDGTIKAWNTQTGALIATGEGHTRDAWALGLTNEPNALIVSGSFDRTVRVWDLNPVLRDVSWQRRRNFCMFISMLGHCSRDNSSGTNGGVAGCVSAEEQPMMSAPHSIETVFCSPPLYRTIAAFL